jgi:hypothetical protein
MPIVPRPDDNAREQTPIEEARDLLSEAQESIIEFLGSVVCTCDKMIDAETGDDLGPCPRCTAEFLEHRIEDFLEPDTCNACHGSGHDPTGHKWPDGTPAACELCDGYGDTKHRPGPFKVITRCVNHWEDCWQIDDAPWRFATREEAEAAITDHIADCEASRLSGEYDRSDFRIIPADQPPNPQP